jgi:hypothetical protein
VMMGGPAAGPRRKPIIMVNVAGKFAPAARPGSRHHWACPHVPDRDSLARRGLRLTWMTLSRSESWLVTVTGGATDPMMRLFGHPGPSESAVARRHPGCRGGSNCTENFPGRD